MRRTVSSILIVTVLMSLSPFPVLAQEIGGTSYPEREEKERFEFPLSDALRDCGARGKMDAGLISTEGSRLGGFMGGFLLGLIGTGLVYVTQSPSDPTAHLVTALDGQSDDCKYMYIESFRAENLKQKKSAALTGGLIGTAIIVGILAVSGQI